MPRIDPESLSYTKAQQLLVLLDEHNENKLFLDGDHWQDGNGWIGPRPEKDHEKFTEIMKMIEEQFVSRNAIDEVIDRHTTGAIGREPFWRLTPIEELGEDEKLPEELSDLIDEGEALLTEWWNNRAAHAVLQQAVRNVLWSDRGPVRMYVPPGLLLRDGDDLVATPTTWHEAMALIYAEAPDPSAATVIEDTETKRKVGIFFFTRGERDEEQWVELVYQDPDDPDVTIIRQVFLNAKTSQADATRYEFDYGGRLTMDQVSRPALINTQVRQCQKALNLACTNLPRAVVTSGFLERVLLNAQVPGYWETDPKDPNKRVKFIAQPYLTGAGTTNFVRGIDWQDEQGRQQITDPDIRWREASEVKPSLDAKRSHYQDILEEVDQAHILLSGEALVSGKSREQARMDFVASVKNTIIHINQLGRWMLETVLAMAEQYMNQPGYFTDKLRADFVCRPDYGPVSADEKRQNADMAKEGLLSIETAMSMNGIDDVDAELIKVHSQPGSNLGLLARQAETIEKLVAVGLPMAVAARMAGIPDEFITEIEEADEEVRKQEEEQRKLEAKKLDSQLAAKRNGNVPRGNRPRPAPAR